MENKRSDRRVKYTKMVLRQSLLELMKTQSISKITVKDICEMADINRGTFYSHYNDPADLLFNVQNELFEEIKTTLARHKGPIINTTETLHEIFKCIAANKDLCQVLFSENGDKEFIKKIIYIAHQQCIDEWSKTMKNYDEQMMEYMYAFVAGGFVGIVEQWMQGGFKESPKQLTNFVGKIITHSMVIFLTDEN